jgi:XTP/dITP diphosphohydrolase
MSLIVATNNPGKRNELRDLLPTCVELLSLHDAGLESPDETGSSFVENALIKARAAAPFADGAIADDSGLQVPALGGQPGVTSARYAGEQATDAQNNARLVRELKRVGATNPAARFVSAVAFVSRDGGTLTAVGTVAGRIVLEPRGNSGFGYDPHFELDDPVAGPLNGRTMAELSMAEKNRVSHRARALRSLVAQLIAEKTVCGGDPAAAATERATPGDGPALVN